MLAGDGKLFVVTEEGQLYCFGAGKADPRHYRNEAENLPPASPEDRERIQTGPRTEPGGAGILSLAGDRRTAACSESCCGNRPGT